MTLTVQLPPELEERARAEAAARGESLPEFVLSLVRSAVGADGTRSGKKVRRRARRGMKTSEQDLSERELDEWRARTALPDEVPPPPIPFEQIRGATRDGRLVRESKEDWIYEYYPVTEHIVSASGVCGGRMTVKGTRISPGVLLGYLNRGESAEQLARDYKIPVEAVHETAELGRLNPPEVFTRTVLPRDAAI